MWPESEQTQELLDAARRGESQAVDRLLQRHRQAVERMVQMRLDRRIRRRVGPSDVVQDVMVEASRRLTDYLENPGMPFHLWIRQIARDRMIDAHRRHRGSARRSVDREQPMAYFAGDERSTMQLAGQLVDGELTPAAAATQQEMCRRIEDAIADMAPQDMEILVMRHYEQLSNQDVARALELSEPAASMRYLRAVRRLKERILGSQEESLS